MIFEFFNININKYPTLSSLALGIFRTHFLRNDEIPQLSGHIAKDIRQGYTGGAVDVYTLKMKKELKFEFMMLTHYILMLWINLICLLVNLFILKVTLKLLKKIHLDSFIVK